jgi:hypothetical protein
MIRDWEQVKIALYRWIRKRIARPSSHIFADDLESPHAALPYYTRDFCTVSVAVTDLDLQELADRIKE